MIWGQHLSPVSGLNTSEDRFAGAISLESCYDRGGGDSIPRRNGLNECVNATEDSRCAEICIEAMSCSMVGSDESLASAFEPSVGAPKDD